jgi:ribonuclease BN (tRNA processing enzyme)
MEIKLHCLGIGKGASYVTKGIPSTAFVISIDDSPYLWIDMGAGIVIASQYQFPDVLPHRIFISHNHSDHTGDLPVLVAMQISNRNKSLELLGSQDVLHLIKTHRLHELTPDPHVLDEAILWYPIENGLILPQISDLSLQLYKTKHSYLCYGFTLHLKEKAIFAYSADSPYDEVLYNELIQARIVVINGRQEANFDHAGFTELDIYAGKTPQCQFWIAHYESGSFQFKHQNIRLIEERQVILLAKD